MSVESATKIKQNDMEYISYISIKEIRYHFMQLTIESLQK